MYEAPFGHAKHGHTPDNPDTNPGQYRQYLEGLYDVLATRAQRENLQPRMSRKDFVDVMMRDVTGVADEGRQRTAIQELIQLMTPDP